MSTAAARRAYTGPTVFSFGFRPFFLMGAAWAALAVPLWIWSLQSSLAAGVHRDWHVHEMLFGFLAAVVAGFLTTAIPNWTGRMPVIGGPLAGLAGLWLAGRLAMLFAYLIGPIAAVIDAAFLVVFAGVVWREVLAGRNWRNLPVAGLVSLMALGNIAFHIDSRLWSSGLGERLALGAAAVLIALIGGRITPSFTRNWMRARRLTPEPATAGRLDQAALGLTGLAALLWAMTPEVPATGAALLLAGLANVARLASWRGWAARSEPLVWVLHLGYAWLAVGLGLLGASRLWSEIPRTAGVHALTAGAVGVMTLAVMTRATRGHTGRVLAAGVGTTAIYVLINLAALVRVAAPFAGTFQPGLLIVSAVLWSSAFGGFVIAYAPMLTRPRATA
ncbi:MAG: NnrS family protein [Phenylobacterium sp.]|uniref:NnrS family protein n=1 Tax=Phenylobacterium sp. TaxID=1871053 RepID=UPI0025EE7DBA|nr:NnrS family protein [Phenylobacterium sp.]MBI1197942.1 NnrS family protein [Phenylobacterium sp.]